VNLIKQLFGRHPQTGARSSSVSWTGQSGKDYAYEVFPADAVFQPLPGNYIYAGQSEDGAWIPFYIAQTRDLHQRLEGHVTMSEAMTRGATHIHAHYCTVGQAARCTEERDLIMRWRPECNDAVEE
jgi:hypothetical protein